MNYKSNGILPYDNIRGGFGYLDRNTYRTQMLKACSLLKEQPELRTTEHFIEKDFQIQWTLEGEGIPSGKKAFSFSIDESAIVFRLILIMEAEEGGIPFEMSIVGPTGAVVRVNPGTVQWQHPAWGLASSNGFFATDSKGVWKIILDEHKNITRLRVKISGVKKGGLVEEMIQRSIKEEQKLFQAPRL